MVRTVPFGKLHKTSAVISGDAIFLVPLVYLAVLNTLCNASFFHVQFYSFMFVRNISTRVVGVNGKQEEKEKLGEVCSRPILYRTLYLAISRQRSPRAVTVKKCTKKRDHMQSCVAY